MGWVGASVAISLLHEGLVRELWLADAKPGLAEGEAMDLAHAASLLHRVKVEAREVAAMREADASLSIEDARKRIVLVDSKGLVYDGRPADSKSGLSPDKAPFAAHLPTLVKRNAGKTFDPTSLADVVKATRCSLLVGAAAVPGAFTETVVKQMAAQNERPIVFALSNPTSKAECTAKHVWTERPPSLTRQVAGGCMAGRVSGHHEVG